MLANHPLFGYGGWHRFAWWEYMKLTFITSIILGVIYLALFKYSWVRKRYLIAYFRLIFGHNKMKMILADLHTLIFVAGTVLFFYPTFYFFTPEEGDYQILRRGYVTYVKNYIKTRIKRKLFRRNHRLFTWWLLENSEQVYNHKLNKNQKLALDFYDYPEDYDYNFYIADEDSFMVDEDIDDEEDTTEIEFELNHNLLFGELELKSQLRGAIYDLFKRKDLLKTSEDVDELVDLFTKEYLRAYMPYGAWFLPTSTATEEMMWWSGEYSQEITAMLDRLTNIQHEKINYLAFLGHVLRSSERGNLGQNPGQYPEPDPDSYNMDVQDAEFYHVNDNFQPNREGFNYNWLSSDIQGPRYRNYVEQLWNVYYPATVTDSFEVYPASVGEIDDEFQVSSDDGDVSLPYQTEQWYKIEDYFKYANRWRFYYKLQRRFTYLPIGFNPGATEIHTGRKMWKRCIKHIQFKFITPKEYLHYRTAVTPGKWRWTPRRGAPYWWRPKWEMYDHVTKSMKGYNKYLENLNNWWKITGKTWKATDMNYWSFGGQYIHSQLKWRSSTLLWLHFPHLRALQLYPMLYGYYGVFTRGWQFLYDMTRYADKDPENPNPPDPEKVKRQIERAYKIAREKNVDHPLEHPEVIPVPRFYLDETKYGLTNFARRYWKYFDHHGDDYTNEEKTPFWGDRYGIEIYVDRDPNNKYKRREFLYSRENIDCLAFTEPENDWDELPDLYHIHDTDAAFLMSYVEWGIPIYGFRGLGFTESCESYSEAMSGYQNRMNFSEIYTPSFEDPLVDHIVDAHFVERPFDFARSGQFGFQDPATPSMEGIIDLHHDLMFFLVIIVIFVLWFLVSSVYHFYIYNISTSVRPPIKKIIVPSLKSHNVLLEIVWTIVPSLILLLIALPSFALIYSMDELLAPRLTFKVIGHQWYWSYEYNHPIKKKIGYSLMPKTIKPKTISGAASYQKIFDSNMTLEEDLKLGELRLLEVNRRAFLPKETSLRVLVTSADVLHSWAVPSLGIKVDACPGRLNQAPLFLKREGTFYGQCSEICGVNHAFMPIVVQSVTPEYYTAWFKNYYEVKAL
jgi:cytochrome c oxidase subunit 2